MEDGALLDAEEEAAVEFEAAEQAAGAAGVLTSADDEADA